MKLRSQAAFQGHAIVAKGFGLGGQGKDLVGGDQGPALPATEGGGVGCVTRDDGG